jgi:hypothetical protein
MLAGLIRLDAAAPLLVAKLKDDDGDAINEECGYALTKIGEPAIDAIAKDFHSAPDHYRLYASSALEDMRGEKVVATALELFEGKGDVDVRAKFIGAALANFDTEGLRLAREFGVYDLPEYRRRLIAVATLTGADLPEMEELRQEVRDGQAKMQERQAWLSEAAQKLAKPRIEEPVDPPVIQPIKSGPKTGRNDPCPCGSGKKYKRCCLGKD